MDTPPALAAALETAVNGYLHFDPDNAARLAPLRDKVVRLELSRPSLTLGLRFAEQTVRVLTDADSLAAADVSIKATPQALLNLARGQTGAEQDIYLQGDIHTARVLQRLLTGLEIDWEDLLARLFGDVPARQLARLSGVLREQGRRFGDKLGDDLSEYLRYEARALPDRAQVERFLDQVDRLRSDLDRLEARVRRLSSLR